MSSSCAFSAVKICNKGVEFLKEAKYAESISTFTVALANVKQMLLEVDEEDESHLSPSLGQPPADLCFPSDVSSECCGSAAAESVSSLRSQDMILLDPSFRTIFCHPITLPMKQEKPTVEVYNKYSFAILFNLALAHHLAGMECPESRKGKLRKALRLYEFAYSIQVQEDIQLQIKYTLGMVNNLGHIQELLGDHQKAHQCFQHLLSTLMYVLEGGEANEDGKWDIFLHNVSHLILRESALAAAA